MDDKKINQGLLWSIGPQFFTYTLSLVFTAVLSRLVLPAEYGLFNLVSTVTAFFMVFADGGIVWSIVSKKEIKDQEVINLYWINVLIGGLMSVTCILIAPFVVAFYGYEELKQLLPVMGLNFLITGFTVPGTMWLKRGLLLKKLAIINLLSLIIGGVVGILAAKNGFGYWSLAIQALTKSTLTMLAIHTVSGMPMGWFSRKTHVGTMLRFSGGLLGFGAVNYFSRNLDNVVIGKFAGVEELAFYAKAYFLMTLPSMLTTAGLSGMMVALLARYQDDKVKFQGYYKNALRLVTLLCCPIAGYFFTFPEDVILLFYGEQWLMAAPLLQVLAIACLTQPMHNTMGWLFTASGQSRKMFHWGCFAAIFLSAGFLVGAQWGAIGVAISYTVVMGLCLTLGALKVAHSAAGIKLWPSIKYLLLVLVSSIFALLITFFIDKILNQELQLLSRIFIRSTLLVIAYAAMLLFFYRSQFFNLFKLKTTS
ncbi:lipopolysaccharide biosynthesis protein [Endozoicomonas sp. SESOKO1]|uniref:lipopolysaccharide biosynthesis protein n=1 Tax=Endozoicomonas sp. SESOKO1 TaxID=2828742 RepID=UPI00214869B7|nr:lipopolysaccharide biosynthesis protein [Endozoicomonas sp. SESOKO1]